MRALFQRLRARQHSGFARLITGLWLACLVGTPGLAAEPVLVLTEEFPPYNFTDQGRITGLGTEVVEAVLKELGLQGQIQSMPWARAYETAKNTPGVLLYSILRTSEREKSFKWVGVIAPADYYLFSLAGRDIRLASLNDAQRWQIGTVQQTVGEQYLLSRGFQKGQNLQSSVRNELNFEKLQQGRIDLWIMNRLTANHLVRQAGHLPGKTLYPALHIEELSSQGGYYMAFGAQTPDATVEQFRKGLEALRRNGTFDRLQRKWQ
jgi:polar amino acid transport system substrate-binding protein